MKRLDGKPSKRKGEFIDLTGLTFGKLTVIKLEKSEERQWTRQKVTLRWYLCRCECGKETVAYGPALSKHNGTQSCGCSYKEWRKTEEGRSFLFKKGTAFRKVLYQYKHDAKRRGLSWQLSNEEFKHLTSSPCYFTGKLPSTAMEAASGEIYMYNGVDRLDSKEGYTLKNCVPCCTEVNFMKRNLPYEKFIELCKAIEERF